MKKKLLCIGLGMMLAVNALAFTACGGTDDKAELNKQLSAAQTLIEQQETEISELEKAKAELQKQIDELNERIDYLKERIEELEGPQTHSAFYSLSEAYKKEYITRENLLYIAENRRNYDAFPELDEETERKIKRDYALLNNVDENDVVIRPYLGVYNGSYVVQIWDPRVYYMMVELEEMVGGIAIPYSGPQITVWRENNGKA